MSTLPANQHFALSDQSIAIAQDDTNEHSVIYIYPIIITEESKDDDVKTKKKRKVAEQPRKVNYSIKTDDPSCIKKLCYSGVPMDVTYSSRYISMSKDGRYLAISWLPNPRLGANIAMKYCVAFDLDRMEDQNNVSKIPCAIIEFSGGSVFTQDGKFVLINNSIASVYSIGDDSEFTLDFSLNLSTTATLSHGKDGKTFDFFPSSIALFNDEDEIISKLKASSLTQPSSTTTAVGGNDNYDDIFFDSSNDEMLSDLEEDSSEYEKMDDDDQWVKVDSQLEDNDDKVEMTEQENDPYQAFLNNDQFIKDGIESIRDYGVIILVSSFPHGDAAKYNYFAWSLEEKRLIFVKQVESNTRYLSAFSKYKNLVAFGKKYGNNVNHLSSHQVLGTTDHPLCTVYDCASGVTVGDYGLPEGRMTSRISQLMFLQDDMYLLAVSHNANHTFFDLWDVLSASHLDTYVAKSNEDQVCKDHSRFVLHDQLPLTVGCGLYMHVEYQRPEATPIQQNPFLSNCHYKLSVNHISFFEEDMPVVHGCQCGKATFYKCDGFNGSLLIPRVTGLVKYDPTSLTADTKQEWEFAFFLDKEHNYMLVSHWDPFETGVNILLMKVYQLVDRSADNKKELHCETYSQDHMLQFEKRNLKYAFMLNRNSFMRERKGLTGYPTLFLDMVAVRTYCIENLSMRMIVNNKITPVLLLQFNYYKKIKDVSLGFLSVHNQGKKRGSPHFVAIPMHPFSKLESCLHGMACQNVISLYDKDGARMREFGFKDYAKLLSDCSEGEWMDTDDNGHERTPIDDDKTRYNEALMKMIDSSSAYFSTMAGYATLCGLAKRDEHHEILNRILKETTKVNYCTLQAAYGDYLMDPLGEALKHGALKNAQCFAHHIKHCMDTYGTEYGHLLLKHGPLMAQHGITVNYTPPTHLLTQ